MTVTVRAETAADQAAIAAVNLAAFGGDAEAVLVDRLRAEGATIASLVALGDDDQVVGHILFSRATLVTPTEETVVASLAPMAVLPPHQRAGIGTALIRQGLEACRRAGYAAIIVVGHPAYYPRFGFSPAVVELIVNPFASGEAFMGLELALGSLTGVAGRVVYPTAFDELS